MRSRQLPVAKESVMRRSKSCISRSTTTAYKPPLPPTADAPRVWTRWRVRQYLPRWCHRIPVPRMPNAQWKSAARDAAYQSSFVVPWLQLSEPGGFPRKTVTTCIVWLIGGSAVGQFNSASPVRYDIFVRERNAHDSPWCNRQHYGFWYRHSRFESWWGSNNNAVTFYGDCIFGFHRALTSLLASASTSSSSAASSSSPRSPSPSLRRLPDLSDLARLLASARPRLNPSLSARLAAAAICAAV